MNRVNLLRGIIALVSIVVVGLASAQSGQRDSQFTARITPVPISPAERNTVTGSGAATASLAGRTLRVQGMFAGLQGPATVGALHLSPVTGVRGPAFAALDVTPAAGGEISGTVELAADQVEALREGRIYIQVHSTTAPDGNLWGWLLSAQRRR